MGKEGARRAGEVHLEAAIPKLRMLSVRGWMIAAFCAAIVVAALGGWIALDRASDELLAHGTRVPGTVVAYQKYRGTPPKITVVYHVADEVMTADILGDSYLRSRLGDVMTVIYDPADPTRVRTQEEPNRSYVLTFLCGWVGSFALAGVPLAVIAAKDWRRRYQAVRRTGWRRASVTVVTAYGHRMAHWPQIHVIYEDGKGPILEAPLTPMWLGDRLGRSAWVGGENRDMVVLFPRGRWSKAPHAVRARVVEALFP